MKIIVYTIDMRLNKKDKFAVPVSTFLPYSEENVVYAKEHSVDGQYTIDEIPKLEERPSPLDRIEAQTTYTAMMTDTLLEV
jgi:hypothetical protein